MLAATRGISRGQALLVLPVNRFLMGSRALSAVIEGPSTANSKDLLNMRLINAREKFRKHPTDSGSSSVQIAILTEKIKNMSRHAMLHKKDKASIRGFQQMINKRRKLMKYLKKTDLDEFRNVTTELGILKEAASVRI